MSVIGLPNDARLIANLRIPPVRRNVGHHALCRLTTNTYACIVQLSNLEIWAAPAKQLDESDDLNSASCKWLIKTERSGTGQPHREGGNHTSFLQ